MAAERIYRAVHNRSGKGGILNAPVIGFAGRWV
jgi:hypothetical protein